MTPSEIQDEIEKFSSSLDDFGTTTFNSSELWQKERVIFEGFKEVRFYNHNERQEAWTRFQELVDKLKEKQTNVNRENERFADEAESRIDKIRESLDKATFINKPTKEDFEKIKTLIDEVSGFLRQKRFPTKDRRIEVWDKFNLCRDELRKEEDKYYSELRGKINQRLQYSQELTEKILDTIRACHPNSAIATLSKLLEILLLFSSPLGYIVIAFSLIFKGLEIGIGDEKKPKSPLRLKSEALRNVRKFIQDNKNDITSEDKQKIYSELDRVQVALDNAWTEYKAELQRKQKDWEQRKREKEKKHLDWEYNQQEFLSKLKNRLANQIAFKGKLEVNFDKQKDFLSKLERRLNNQEEYLRKCYDELDKLGDMYSNAKGDNFRDKVSGWIDEKKSKISEVENDIENLENKIREVRNNINGFPDKIRDVKKDIENLEVKIDEVRGNLGK